MGGVEIWSGVEEPRDGGVWWRREMEWSGGAEIEQRYGCGGAEMEGCGGADVEWGGVAEIRRGVEEQRFKIGARRKERGMWKSRFGGVWKSR